MESFWTCFFCVVAALPLLGTATGVRHMRSRGRRVDVLVAARARARHHAAQFPSWRFSALWRMASCINMATLLVRDGLPIATVGQLHDGSTRLRRCNAVHGLHSTIFFHNFRSCNAAAFLSRRARLA